MKFSLQKISCTAAANLVLGVCLFCLLLGCTSEDSTAGIEIGNPSVDSIAQDTTTTGVVDASLSLTANFSVDYAEVNTVLSKVASSEEQVVLDSFDLLLTGVRTYSSYYIYVEDYDASEGMLVWPTEESSACDVSDSCTLNISFTEGSYVDEAFKNIELLDGGYLKEIGVSFEPYLQDHIFGRVLLDGVYVPFVYDLGNFKNLQLLYHYSQIEIDSVANNANLSVVFRAKLFTDGVDFSTATVSDDGIIYIDTDNNENLWNQLNERFVPSFQPLRYEYTNEDGEDSSAYVDDVWSGIAAAVNENTIINGSFRSPFTTDWILVTQYGGEADTSVIEESSEERIMKVSVTAGGDSSFSVQLIQENVALIAGVTYQCVFTIWSDVEGEITARIGSYVTYEAVGFSEHVNVTTDGQSISFTFTPEVSDPFARFELNLGKMVREFWIKEVKVIRLTE